MGARDGAQSVLILNVFILSVVMSGRRESG